MAARKLNVNIAPMIKRLEAVTKKKVKTRMIGSYASVFRGSGGYEFEGYEKYNLTNDASLIDWKASARANELLIKLLKQERVLEVFFMIDTSSSMIFGSQQKLKNEYALEMVATLAFAISAAGDKFGFATFSENVANKFPPSRGISHFYKLTKILTNPEIYGGGFNFDKALDFLLYYLKKRSALVFIVSDFIGMKREWFKKLKLIGSKMEVIAVIVRDPRDEYLPKAGLVLMGDPFSKKKLLVNTDLVKDEYGEYVRKEEALLYSHLRESRIDFVKLVTSENFVNPLLTFFAWRRQKWR